MPFMNAEVTEKRYWLRIDGSCGVEFIPSMLFNINDVKTILTEKEKKNGSFTVRVKDEDFGKQLLSLVRDYCENREIWEAELIFGYGVRSFAAGYLDSTPWYVFTSKREAERAAREEQRKCEGRGD